jgi:catechol 2,3-dioxygenase-like lactoylglutathione lyase family enzyme
VTVTVGGIRQVKVPVSDLRCSADWYRALLGLELYREFVEGDEFTGVVLAGRTTEFFISFRLRSRVPGQPDFAGFDLFSLGVAGLEDLQELAIRADTMGARHGEIADRGDDGYHLDVSDPDGIVVRFLTTRNPDAPPFAGVVFTPEQAPVFYSTPRLDG